MWCDPSEPNNNLSRHRDLPNSTAQPQLACHATATHRETRFRISYETIKILSKLERVSKLIRIMVRVNAHGSVSVLNLVLVFAIQPSEPFRSFVALSPSIWPLPLIRRTPIKTVRARRNRRPGRKKPRRSPASGRVK
jgi:hypothetical protein